MNTEFSRRKFLNFSAITLSGALLSACGFQVRSTATQPLPFQKIYLGMSEYSPLAAALRRNLEANGQTRVVTDQKEADVLVQVLNEQRRKDILSVGSNGRVREYRLVQIFGFRMIDQQQRELTAPATLQLTRDITWNDNDVLGKTQEEQMLYKDMESDLVQQLLRRMQRVRLNGEATTPRP